MGAVHAAIVFVPVLVVALVVVDLWLAFLLAVVVAGVVTVLRCRDIDGRLALALGAEPVPADDEARLRSLHESVSMAVGVTPPVLHRIRDDAVNAVVWGSGARAGSLALTTGLLERVDRLGLEGVLARLLVDLRDGVVEGPTVATVLFGPLARGPLAGVVPRLARTTADPDQVLAGDLDAARAIAYPPGLAAALEMTAGVSTAVARSPHGSRPLWLVSPGAPPTDGDEAHPPVVDRVDVLREL